MGESQWYEYTLLGVVLTAYTVLPLYAFLNRREQAKQSARSGVLTECEQCSVALARHIAPGVALQEYRFRGMHPTTASIDIEFEDLGVKLKKEDRCVLEGVTGEFKAGKMAAIMGPSGAGKTTFLNALCGKAHSYGRVSGELRINGKVSSIAEIKQVRGFVPQDDIVHECLTVREQLYYSARLRNAEDTPSSEIDLIVEDVLHVMQLADVQHSIVGSVEKRGISGGQRKRVNIGLELAARPTVLMLDEPTSGLDATTALDIIQSLKRLTEIGMTVIMVIHQPRYSLFTLIDEVLLLGLGGRTVYLGPSDGALSYFQNIGFEMPDHENPADWFMDVISGKVKNNKIERFETSMLAKLWKDKVKSSTREESTHVRAQTDGSSDLFAQALDTFWQNLGIQGDRAITQTEFCTLLRSAGIPVRSDAVLDELMQRIGFQDGLATKSRFLEFLLNLRGSLAHDAISDISDMERDVEAFSDSSSSSRSTKTDGKMWTGKRKRFCAQYPVLVQQNSIRWLRCWQQNLIAMLLMILAAAVFGAQCKDKLVPQSPLAPLKINLSHVALGLMTGISCLSIFGGDRPVFWRESASGIRVTAFYLARVTISLFDVLIWCYLFSAVWYVSSQAPCSFWTWFIAFRMTAISAAGWGVLISTLVPSHSSTLAIAVVLLIMGGAISEPQSIAEAPGTFGEVLALVSPFTWSSGENYLTFIDQMGGVEQASQAAMPIIEGYETMLGVSRFGDRLGYVLAAYISCVTLGIVSLTAGYLGLRCSHRGKQA